MSTPKQQTQSELKVIRELKAKLQQDPKHFRTLFENEWLPEPPTPRFRLRLLVLQGYLPWYEYPSLDALCAAAARSEWREAQVYRNGSWEDFSQTLSFMVRHLALDEAVLDQRHFLAEELWLLSNQEHWHV
ncbi:MAG: hypothetical protein E6R03_18270 [Hyphomicrobiaceae bacterium]|nr:MAG: hypothetical protein E6R03_18270 [Hyphomicrobiaceae bacterium]